MESKLQFFVSCALGDGTYGEWVTRLFEYGGYTVIGVENLSMINPENFLSVFSWAEKVVPILSPSAINSQEEWFWGHLYSSNPNGFLPVLVEPCRFPGHVGMLASIDMTRYFESTDAASSFFLDQVAAALRGPGRPSSPPHFPG